MATKKNTRLQHFLKSHFKEFQDTTSDRIRALYSDFSNQELLNEYAYKINVGFWTSVILESSVEGLLDSENYSMVINVDTLPNKFQIPVLGKPLSLDCVLSTMEDNQQLMPLSTFRKLYSPPSLLHRFYHTIFNRQQQEEELYVVIPTLETVVRKIRQDIGDDHLWTLTRFKSKYAHKFIHQLELTHEDIMCVVSYMQKHHGVGFMESVQGYHTSYEVIKFPMGDGIAEITEYDRAIIALRTTSHALSTQIDLYQKESKALEMEAIQEKKKGHQAKTLYCLKRKKTLDGLVDKRLTSVETIETVLMKVESSHDDIQVVQAFNMGANALSSLLKSEQLSPDSIDQAIDKIHDALQDQQQIEDAIQLSNEQHYNNDAQLEQELAELASTDNNQDIEKEIQEIEVMFSDIQTSDTLPKTTNHKIKELA
ncbi:hypothetical protein K501DRAFT_242083 [Backusella circina FSU 941]|nr:hypothetical protein K501DRAFT_242083 [Backusella circina FSU 941]